MKSGAALKVPGSLVVAQSQPVIACGWSASTSGVLARRGPRSGIPPLPFLPPPQPSYTPSLQGCASSERRAHPPKSLSSRVSLQQRLPQQPAQSTGTLRHPVVIPVYVLTPTERGLRPTERGTSRIRAVSSSSLIGYPDPPEPDLVCVCASLHLGVRAEGVVGDRELGDGSGERACAFAIASDLYAGGAFVS